MTLLCYFREWPKRRQSFCLNLTFKHKYLGCRVAPINCDFSGTAERLRLMVCRLIADYHGREFHHYFSCSSQWLPSRSSVFGLTRQWTTVHIMLDNFYAGILFSLGGVSPMSWNFEDELDIGKRSMPQVYQFKRDLVYFLVGVSYSFTKRQIDSSSFVAIT